MFLYIIYIYISIVRSEFVGMLFADRTWIVVSYGPAVLAFYGRHPHLGWATESCSHATVDSNVEQSIYVFLCYDHAYMFIYIYAHVMYMLIDFCLEYRKE